MVSRPLHYCITIQILELHVWTVTVWMVMHKITCLDDERPYVMFTKYTQRPIITIAVMAIIEEHLGILGRRATHGGKNGPWVYANHNNPYTLMANCGIPNHWLFCNGNIECSGCIGEPPQGRLNTVHQRRGIQVQCTRMEISHQSGSSKSCHT